MKRALICLTVGIIVLIFAIKVGSLYKSSNSINRNFPLAVGNTWEYEGTSEELVDGELKRSSLKKTVESSTYVITGNTVDFEPDKTDLDKIILTFPLAVGQKWGDKDQLARRTDGYYVWEVESKTALDVLGSHFADCYRIAFKTLPDTRYYVFCSGLGIVEEGYTHNGTPQTEIYKLTGVKLNKPKS